MFQIKRTTRKTRLTHTDGRSWNIPEKTKSVCFDKDGEIWAYESGDVHIIDGNAAWTDQASYGFVVQIGKVNADEVAKIWREEIRIDQPVKQPNVKPEEPAEPAARLDGSKLRAKVTQILDKRMKDGVIGAVRARHFLRDLGSEGFSFEGYRTADLVLVLTHIGCNLTLTRDYMAFRAIDDAVHEVWAQ